MTGKGNVYLPVHSDRLYEQIVAQIEARILDGELQPGDQLPAERELAQQFGVSRTAVREAVKALSQKGLVEVYPGRGTFVTDRTTSAVRHSINLMMRIGNEEGTRDLVEIREILEPEIAARAAVRATDDDISALQNAVCAMDNAMEDPDTYIESDLDFHLALAHGTGNSLILVLIDTLIEMLRDHRRRAASVEGGLERGQPFHKEMLAAVQQRDPDRARESMRAHLQQVRKEIETSLISSEITK